MESYSSSWERGGEHRSQDPNDRRGWLRQGNKNGSGAGEEELLVRCSCVLAVIVSAGVVASATKAERED